MYTYLVLFAIASVLYFSKNNNLKGLFVLFAILAICIAGFRDMIGGYDVYIYAEVYEKLDLIQDVGLLFEPGFIIYYKVLRFINEDRHFMFFISAIIILGLYGYYLKKISIAFYFSLFIFFCKFYLMSFVYLRQGLAMVVVLISLYYLLLDKKKWAIILAIVAFLIHKSAILFLPFVFMGNIKFSNLQIILIVAFIGLLSFSPLGSFLLTGIGDTVNEEKITSYASKSGTINIFYVIEGALIIVLALVFRSKFYANKATVVYFNGILFYGFIIVFGITNATFIRLGWYYFMFICLGLPYVYYFIDLKSTKSLFKTAVFVYYTAIFLRLMTVYDGGDFMPYKSIFQDFDRGSIWKHMEYRNFRDY